MSRDPVGGASGAPGESASTSPAPIDDRLGAVIARVRELEGERVVTPLSGGITNRNVRVDVAGASYVVRLAGPRTELLGIDRAREHACALVAHAAGVGAEVVAFVPEHGALVTRFVEGRVLAADEPPDVATVRRIGVLLARLHAAAPVPGEFTPFATVRAYHAMASGRGFVGPPQLRGALSALARIEAALTPAGASVPCHNDLLPANFIDAGERLVLIDWEYAAMGDRFFDLGNLAVNHRLDGERERALLDAYVGDVREDDLRRLRLMRLASDAREALWGFLQSRISSLDFDFFGYGCEHLERFLAGLEATGGEPQGHRPPTA